MDACRLKSQHPAGTLRDLRQQLGLSQPAFAALLGVSAESYRTWDTGRRSAPPPLMAKAADLARTAKGAALPLYIWATTTGVHVRTLRQAARDGRLEVSYSARMFFGHAAPVATGTAVQRFKDHYYRRTTRWNRPTRPPSFAPPDDYDQRLIAWRRRMGLTQAALAVAIGAANRAVVYQWESHRRTPSPFFWKKIVELGRARGIAVHEKSSTARSAPTVGPCLLPADSAHQRET